MIPNPIHKVLSTLSCHAVQHLLMGGQACVFYGAAEFSRDCDIVIIADPDNLARLSAALDELQATCIAIPPLDWHYLERGHALHFRCQHPEAMNMRLDVMTKMRGCDEFDALWERRTTLQNSDGTIYELLGIDDLVKAKKTQRDKDWPMIRRLVDAHYDEFRNRPSDERVRFWLSESRSPRVLIDVVAANPALFREVLLTRPLLANAIEGRQAELQVELDLEQAKEQHLDELYWRPLKIELEALRLARRQRDIR